MLAALFVASSAFADNAAALRELTVRVVADQTFSRMSGWERKAKEQFDFVAEDIEKVLGVRITIIGYSEWTHNEEPNLFGLASRMVNEVPPEGADILVGFTLSPRRSPKERVRTDGVTIPYRGTMLRWYQGSRDHNFFLPYILFHSVWTA
jgi:hypothetical protein